MGQVVRDTLTGIEGTAVGRTEWLFGCVRIAVQPWGSKEGVPFDVFVVDEPQLEVIEPEAAPKAEPRHGLRSDAARKTDVR